MTYLTTEDMAAFLDEREIAALKRDYEADGTDKLPIGISYAENYVKDRLAFKYDLATEYGKIEANRSTTLLEILAHIAIWKLCATFPTVQLDGKRHYNYEQALKDLDKIARGELGSTIPLKATAKEAIQWGTTNQTDVIY